MAKPTLVEIRKGIYAFNDLLDFNLRDFPIVLVHPFCKDYGLASFQYPDGYLENIKRLAEAHAGPVITLEEAANLSETVRKIFRENAGNRFL